MANRESYPASLFPMQGDLLSSAGQVKVRVVGIQNEPVSPTIPAVAQGLIFNGSLYEIVYINSQLQVEGTAVSDDYTIAVNQNTTRPGDLVNGS